MYNVKSSNLKPVWEQFSPSFDCGSKSCSTSTYLWSLVGAEVCGLYVGGENWASLTLEVLSSMLQVWKGKDDRVIKEDIILDAKLAHHFAFKVRVERAALM